MFVYQKRTCIVLPADLAERNGVDVLVKNEGDRNEEAKNSVALGADGVRQNLQSIRHDQRRERNIIRSIKQKYKRNNRMRSRLALRDRIPRRAHCLQDEEEEHSSARSNKERPAADALDEGRGRNGPGEVPDLEDAI